MKLPLKLLVANRGEIAIRVMKTAKKMGIKTVGIYSEADSNSSHLNWADEAFCVGPALASSSYLNQAKLLSVAMTTGAQQIHPGYGFLSENPEFVNLVQKEGIKFIGPPADAMRAMGSKSQSKELMNKAGVPTIPGYSGEDQSLLHEKARTEIGYPVMIKAIRGGGGKGMRIVHEDKDFEDMLQQCKREAKKSFGDDRVLVEKYIKTPRHIEVQVFRDAPKGMKPACVYLWERDCSVQRRHQKVIEEAPAPGMSMEDRKMLGQLATRAADAVGYEGAGTVEFIYDVDQKKYYFMEMNCRLQVEHPITEYITGLDLVKWQILVASGRPIPIEYDGEDGRQDQIQDKINSMVSGHAFESRIYAEDTRNGAFLPASGTITHLKVPSLKNIAKDFQWVRDGKDVIQRTPNDSWLRIDSHVRQGDEISVHYDPMIAKLITFGANREEALQKMQLALDQYQVGGLQTNIGFLKKICQNENFRAGVVDTNFIPNNKEQLFEQKENTHDSLIQAALSMNLKESDDVPFRVNMPSSTAQTSYKFVNGDHVHTVDVARSRDSYTVSVDGKVEDVSFVTLDDGQVTSYLKDKRLTSSAVQSTKNIHIFNNDGSDMLFGLVDEDEPVDVGTSSGKVVAPMPSKIAFLHVKEGQAVTKGQPLIVLEAMKMEHVLRASKDGVIKTVRGNVGDLVSESQLLIALEDEGDNK